MVRIVISGQSRYSQHQSAAEREPETGPVRSAWVRTRLACSKEARLSRAYNKNMNIQIDRWSEINKPDAGELRSRLIDEGYSVFQWSDEPGTKYGPHAHGEDQSHWIVSGELELRVGHETYVLRAGDRDFLPGHTIHSAFVPGAEPVVYLIGAMH